MAIGGVIADSFNSVVTPIGGGAAAVSAIFTAFEVSYGHRFRPQTAPGPQLARAAAEGSVVGAILGAFVLLVDSLFGH